MYFNSNFSSEFALPVAMRRSPAATPLPASSAAVTGDHVSEITVLTSIGHAANKRFYLDENQQVAKDNFQNAFLFAVTLAKAGSIDDLARLIESCSTDNHRILIRGLPVSGNFKRIRKTGENFAEHSDGTPWAMLDFDNISVPDGIDPLSAEAIEWVIAKLPPEFHNVAYFYQHSGSAGILKSDGSPLKSGLNLHLFFWLNRRVPGTQLSAVRRQLLLPVATIRFAGF